MKRPTGCAIERHVNPGVFSFRNNSNVNMREATVLNRLALVAATITLLLVSTARAGDPFIGVVRSDASLF